MAQVKNGDTVKVHYTGKFEDGTVFDSSLEREPLQIEMGAGEVIQGFEDALIGMSPDESKSINIPSDMAYGPHRPEMVVMTDKKQFEGQVEPKVGDRFEIRQENGQALIALVTSVTESSVTLDANHPLAGKDLSFDIQLVDILK
jgi:FKBP-type peptidyl-prolyl cis-trans isomerase 2